MTETILKQIEDTKLIPVVTVESREQGLEVMKALTEGGLAAAEVTFRTPAAEEALAAMVEAYPEALIGAGTVLNAEQAERAVKAGAKFIVSPGFSKEVVYFCQERDIAVIPGCMTPTEMQYAIACGLHVVKFFPAEAAGGLKMLKAVAAPYPDLKFMPTGGISEDNVTEYLKFDRIIACGGSWMTAAARHGDYEEVCRCTERAVELVGKIR